ncbi:Zn(2)-C6 fungal-type domain-containing protein [Fusarium falciforme]|uniref:Zn(2)-C6 fungal-type domain-containing protein n=1 Tax=Fusarium falciforme TaxID=195108 RepID=UPI00230138BD|nr:Zn(2)-C6 fungal-type domain-containing protein [Fusarium falciforme]WAO90223.1 Zn(2)-C6 fungal-type domain-containing protein [Fusarium falciforme]
MKNFKQKKKRRLAKNQGHAQPRVQSPHASRPPSQPEQCTDTLEVTCQDTTSSLDRQPWQSRILSGCSFPKPLQYDEASLLMHYLDHVFPYQYPFCGKETHHLELEFHTNALSQLQDFIVSFNTDELRPDDENLVEIIACGVALISFEQRHECDLVKAVSLAYLPLQRWFNFSLSARGCCRVPHQLGYGEQ